MHNQLVRGFLRYCGSSPGDTFGLFKIQSWNTVASQLTNNRAFWIFVEQLTKRRAERSIGAYTKAR